MVGTGLYDPSGDEPASSYGLIAESVEYSDNNSWVVFNLRKEARFHDGKPITAYDVAFSYRLLIKDGHPQYRTNLRGVKRVDILNRHRIRFVFEQPNNPLLIMRLGELRCCRSTTGRIATSRPPPSSRRWAAVPTASRRCNPGARWCSNACATGGGEAASQPGQVQLQPRRGRVLPRQRGGVRSVQGR